MASLSPSESVELSVSAGRRYRVAVVGNPNTGKTTLFNALTGLSQHTGNYPGVTVESALGGNSAKTRIVFWWWICPGPTRWPPGPRMR